MTTGALSEYDAFGPWIYPIDGQESLPRLFRPHWVVLEGNVMAFKIPRDIERRNATPEMDLYDAVVAVFRDRILYLERRESGGERFVAEKVIPMGSIDSIDRWTCLLDGVLTLYTDDRPFIIPYNTVSDGIMRRAVQLIRSFMPRRAPRLPPLQGVPAMTPSHDFMEFGFVTFCNKTIKENPDLGLIAYQPFLRYRIPLRSGPRWLKKLGLTESVKSAFAVLRGDRELVIIIQTHHSRSRSTKAYTYSETILPLGSLGDISAAAIPQGPKLLALRTRHNGVDLRCDPENPAIRGLLGIADGEAYVLTTVGAAKADNIDKVGTAEAGVIQKKTDAMGREQFAIVQVAEHLAQNKVKIVPDILIQGSGDGSGHGSLVEALIGTELLKGKMLSAEAPKEGESGEK